MWDDDERIGYARPWPRSYEELGGRSDGCQCALRLTEVLGEGQRFVHQDSTSSKTSLTTRTQHMEISEEQLHVKPITLHKIRHLSPHAERLRADYHKHLAQDDECCYIYEANHSKNLRSHSEESDHQQDEDDDCSPRDEPVTTSDPGRFGPRQTRQTTRMESFTYPSP
jgi:hypothetical protein